MLEGAHKLELELPRRRAPGSDAFDTSPKHIKGWVASLPMADTGEAAQLILAALKEVNRLEIPPSRRFKFLERLRGPVHQLDNALSEYYIGKSFPLPPRSRQVANLAREFQVQMATGYKTLVADLIKRSGLAVQIRRVTLITSIHRAIRYLSQVLLKSYQLYSPYPEYIWREIHQLYSFTTKKQFQARSVKDNTNLIVKDSTVADVYKQILLLAVCSPYRLRQGDIATTYVALEKWSPLCGLSPVRMGEQRWEGLFGVPADIDDQPDHLETKKGATGRLEWVLDTSRLAELLHKQLNALSQPGTTNRRGASDDLPPNVTPELLQRLMQSWRMMRNRGFARVPSEGEDTVDVVLGLSAIHQFISGKSGLGPQPDDMEGLEETELAADYPVAWAAEAGPSTRHEVLLCKVQDEGAGGYRLKWGGDSRSKAQWGELLGIRRTVGHRGEQWGIGVIRWMRAREDAVLEVGVQMLAPNAQSAEVRVANVEGRVGEALPSLILPAVEAVKRPETLVVPLFLTQFSDNVQVKSGGEERFMRLTRLVERTDAFAQFEFEPCESLALRKDVERRGRSASDG